MFEVKKIKNIREINIRLQKKNLIVLIGKKGYIMCGYLNLNTANKFKDVAIRVKGVSKIEEVLNTKVENCSIPAKKLGIYIGQPIKEVLEIIS